MKFIVATVFLLGSFALRAENEANLFKEKDRKVFTEAAEAIGLNPFKLFGEKREFTVADFKRELHARLEVETTALQLEKNKVFIVQSAVDGAKSTADIVAKVKDHEDKANKATKQHFTADAVKETEEFTKFRTKAEADIKALDAMKFGEVIKSIKDELAARQTKYDARMKEIDAARDQALKQNKEFFAGLMGQIKEVIDSKDPQATVDKWNREREAVENRVKKLTDAELLLLTKEVEMLKYAKKLTDSIAEFRKVETDPGRRDWLDQTEKQIEGVVTQKYSPIYFLKHTGQWGFIEEMNQRYITLQKATPFLSQLKAPADGQPSGSRNNKPGSSGGNRGGVHGDPGKQ